MRYPFDRFRLGTRYGVKGGLWRCGWHSGADLISGAAGGDGLVHPLYAGRVFKIGRSGRGYGNCVYVRHADGYLSVYAHLKTVYVRQDMEVGEDTALGVEGMTGNATGPHLHLEVHRGDYHYPSGIDPLAFIEERLREEYMEKQLKLCLNGVEKSVTAIEQGGHNFVKLQDLRDERIAVSFDAGRKMPLLWVRD